MCSISDFFVGRVFELYHDDQSEPPKPKMSVIVGVCEDQSGFGSVFINSGINPHKLTDELMPLQYEIAAGKEFPFLKHNSVVDCSRLVQRFPSSISRDIIQGRGRLMGTIPSEHMAKIIKIIQNADPIPPYFIEYYGIR